MSRHLQIYSKVLSILESSQVYRDDDNKLVSRYWADECESKGFNIRSISAFQLLTLYATKQLTLADSITRLRRKAQEEHIHLRGLSYREKQEQQTDVVDDLRNMK